MQDFTLHPRLVADTAFVTDWMLSRVLLMDDMRYPWVILVPRRPHLVELFDLTKPDRALLVEGFDPLSSTQRSRIFPNQADLAIFSKH